jgi:ABC-type transport system involved in multi-copper enzyme maturation permease subunit
MALRNAHLSLIAKHSFRHGIRGGAGLVSIALTLLVGLFLANCAIGPFEGMSKSADEIAERGQLGATDRAKMQDKINAELLQVAGKVMGFVTDMDSDQLKYLVDEKPAMVSTILVLLFLATPFFACLGGFNQTSGDIATKGLRFLLIRTERENIFWGRFMGTFLFSAAVNLILFAILAVYMAVKINVHPPGDMILWTIQGYLRMMVFVLPYIAMCAWISAAIDSPFGSLAINLMFAYLIPLMIGFGKNINEAVGYGQYITPWGFKYWLLQPAGGQFFLGILAMFGFTALFTFLGHTNFRKRDL